MAITHDYEVTVNWLQDKQGVLYAPELNDEISVATPPQFPGGIEKIWSPEHLFTAAVNSCLMTTFLAIASNSQLRYNKFTSKGIGKLEMVDGKYIMSSVSLYPTVVVDNEAEIEKANKVLQKAEANCLISNSIKSTVHFYPEIKVVTTS